MSKIDYQVLREAAEKATQGEWVAFISPGTGTYAVHTPGDKRCEDVIKWTGFDGQKNAENNARYIAAFNPEVVQALLDERERNQQYIKRRDQENEDIALTVGKLRVELEGKDSKIANLTAERDALREGEMGDARHSNTRGAADIYFQLVEECEIPAGGSLVEYVDDMREKLEAAEKRIAELESGSQAQKLVEAIIVAIENEQERLFDEDYLMDSKECIDVIREEVKRWNDSRAAGFASKESEMDGQISIVRPGACDDREIRLIIRLAMGKTITALITPENLALALTGKSDLPVELKLRNVEIKVK